MIGFVEEDNPILASFVNGSWIDLYELRLGNELISEETWSDAVLQDESDVTIHIVEKPQLPLSHRLRPSSSYAYDRPDFSRRRRSYYAPSASYGESSIDACAASSSICADRSFLQLLTYLPQAPC